MLDAGLPIVGGDYFIYSPLKLRSGSHILRANFRMPRAINLFAAPTGRFERQAIVSHCTVTGV
ncbi:hypothetical protein CDN99_06515 [Roseateles aquatilis]|uniref:Uncharacterized protein n=1 Tax=Roseateles aquatilis TaxID=431061 RepID=A0A246JH72_9BURK|nr:hypothetical protein CDN99_06515 [Roseateles aquatilis]